MTRLGRAGALLQADLAGLPRDKGVLLARVFGGASWKLGDDAVGRESIERAGRRTGVTWAVEGARQERQQEPPSVRIDDNDFIRQHSFHEGPFVAFKEGRLRGLYRRDPRQEAFVMRLQVSDALHRSKGARQHFDLC
ncbi:unnamed protein product [Ostreobium quekettii]|uniref:Uncharacterized protein n=1 Tax=Ostreobium quekettii TaxID=121088 RepID=A0A8S1JBB7_9CHLO|nr:unnamed protein product [Ostreobium quekettii]